MVYTKHTIGNASLTTNNILLNSGESENYNARGISFIHYEYGQNRRCNGSLGSWSRWNAQLIRDSISYDIGYSSLPPWMSSVPGPSKSRFFNSLNYTVFHKDDNPLISNCIPHPSSYGMIIPYDKEDIIYDWYNYFRDNRHTYLLLDQLDNNYYEILWDNSSQTYTIQESNNIVNYKLIDQIYVHNYITNVFKKAILYGGSLNLVEIEPNESVHHQTQFIVRSIDYDINPYSRFYKIELDSTMQGELIFVDTNNQMDMFETHPQFISNDQISVDSNLYLLEKYKKGNKLTKCLAYIGFHETRLIQPAFKISQSTILNNFEIQKSVNKRLSLDDQRIYLKIYDENFNLIYSNKLVEINDIQLNFDKYWLEVSDKFAAYNDITYLGSSTSNTSNTSSINRFNIDVGTTILYITFDIDYSDLINKPPDIFEESRGITFDMSKSANTSNTSNTSDDADKVGFFEFRKPYIINNVDTVTQNMHGRNGGNRVDYRLTTTYWNKYSAGIAGFKSYDTDTKRYKYEIFFNSSAPPELVAQYAIIISSTNIDVKIYKLLVENKEFINVKKYDTNFIREYKYNNLGEISLLAFNLPVLFDNNTSVTYSTMKYEKKINYWMIKGVHSNLDAVRTYISFPNNPSRTRVFDIYRNDELSKVIGNPSEMERYPTHSYTGVTRQGQFSQTSDKRYYCGGERPRIISWDYSDVKWNYMLPDGTIHTMPFDSNWNRCSYTCYHSYGYAYYFKNYFHTYLYKHQGIYEHQLNTGVMDINIRVNQRNDFYVETLSENIIPFKYKLYGTYNLLHPWSEPELNWNKSLIYYNMLYESDFAPKSVQLGNTLYFYMFINLRRVINKDDIQLGDQIINNYVEYVTDRTNMDINKFFLSGMTITYLKIKGLNTEVFYDRFSDTLYDLNWIKIVGDDRDAYISFVEYRYKLSMDIMNSLFLKIDNNGNCNFNSDYITDVIEFPKINSRKFKPRIDSTIIDDNKRKWFNPIDNAIRSIPILYEK